MGSKPGQFIRERGVSNYGQDGEIDDACAVALGRRPQPRHRNSDEPEDNHQELCFDEPAKRRRPEYNRNGRYYQ